MNLTKWFIGKVKQLWRAGLLIGVLLAASPFVLRLWVEHRYDRAIYEASTAVPAQRTAIVFGAAIWRDRPSTVLRDRLDAAIELYRAGRVDHLILSGDGRAADYDEPGVMARYARERGVAEADLTLDRSGLRTYDTCYRAQQVYGAQGVVLVTQDFHLPRALFICEGLGLDAVGFAADQRAYRGAGWYNLRELAALTVAAWDILIRPVPDGGLRP